MNELKAFMSDIGEAYRKQKGIQKSDDIINFISTNWKLFVPTRSDMVTITSQLGGQIAYTVDALCDALGVPENVYFKRTPVVDIGGTLLNFEKSKLLDLFRKCREVSENGEACLFVVAGQKSICITNMQTQTETCNYDFWYRDDKDEIHVFRAAEAQNRLPNLFNPKEKITNG